MHTKLTQKGFTLLEILVAMVLLTVISVVLVGSLAPWLNFKQKLDTERKLSDLKSVLTAAYEANAMSIERASDSQLILATGTVVPTAVDGERRCIADDTSWKAMAEYLPDGPQSALLDGYNSPFCILISPQLSAPVNGVTVYYHNVAVVSMGRAGILDEGTRLDSATGGLTLAGDNLGVFVSGFETQKLKLNKTQARLDSLATLYETYFTAQYLGNPARDITVDYFATDNPAGYWDSPAPAGSGVVPGTGTLGALVPALNVLHFLGVGPVETVSAYESPNQIYIANYNECISNVCVKSSVGGGTPPYTALLYTPIPGPSGTYLIKTVNGNY